MIGNGTLIFIGRNDKLYEVKEMPEDLSLLEQEIYYIDLVSMNLYLYVGELTGDVKHNLQKGTICKFGDRYLINRRTIEDSDYDEFSISNVKFESELDFKSKTAESIVDNYIKHFDLGLNKSMNIEIKLKNSGDIYMPEIKSTDDILTKIMKEIIIRKKIVLSNYKDKFEKDYALDNLRSALNGTTSSMTITKFLDWCKLLDLHWKFELRNDPKVENIINPLIEPIVVSKDKFLWEEFGEVEKGVFKVPCTNEDDPLKRLVKVAVIRKHMIPTTYRDKGSSPHLLNNMMSALKRKSKMMITYFSYWCEILSMEYQITLTDKESGITVTTDSVYNIKEIS